MHLPPFPEITDEALKTIAEQHGLAGELIARLPETGIFNEIYALGQSCILRIPRQDPAFVRAIRRESIAVPLARQAGVRTPALLAFDDSLRLLPVPYTIYERVHGETFGLLDLDETAAPHIWRELGCDLALLHQIDTISSAVTELSPEELPDPRQFPEQLARKGYFTTREAKWLMSWLERLAPAALTPVAFCLVHGDIQATNMMVTLRPLAYLALIDWGSASYGDPAWDFAGIPLGAVPFMLGGYRKILSAGSAEAMEPRVLWRHLQLALWLLGREPQPELSWAERLFAMFLEIMRFFLDSPGPAWRPWQPCGLNELEER